MGNVCAHLSDRPGPSFCPVISKSCTDGGASRTPESESLHRAHQLDRTSSVRIHGGPMLVCLERGPDLETTRDAFEIRSASRDRPRGLNTRLKVKNGDQRADAPSSTLGVGLSGHDRCFVPVPIVRARRAHDSTGQGEPIRRRTSMPSGSPWARLFDRRRAGPIRVPHSQQASARTQLPAARINTRSRNASGRARIGAGSYEGGGPPLP